MSDMSWHRNSRDLVTERKDQSKPSQIHNKTRQRDTSKEFGRLSNFLWNYIFLFFHLKFAFLRRRLAGRGQWRLAGYHSAGLLKQKRGLVCGAVHFHSHFSLSGSKHHSNIDLKNFRSKGLATIANECTCRTINRMKGDANHNRLRFFFRPL